jgi:hypothetical protein
MGLQEKRLLKQVLEEQRPQTKAEIKEICGAEIPVEIDQDSFMNDQYAKGCLEGVKGYGMDMAVEALKLVCKDDMGKDAVKEGLKKVLFRNLPNEKQMDLTTYMKEGVVTVEAHWGGAGYVSSGQIQDVIEGGL